MRRLFGTDGIRGVAGEFPLDEPTLHCIGAALASYARACSNSPKVVLGRDTRESGAWLSGILEESLLAGGVAAVEDAGITTTPGLAYLTCQLGASLGIMISASHNPYQDNGVKVFSRDGYKLPDEIEHSIESQVLDCSGRRASGIQYPPRIPPNPELNERYRQFLIGVSSTDCSGQEVGLDVCNGSACQVAPAVFRRLGAKVHVINDQPDGRNINRDCGSLHLHGLQRLVLEKRLNYGVAFDGDADRAIFVTGSGRVFDGDGILFALASFLKQTGQLKAEKVVGTVMSNFALEQKLQGMGLQLVRADVGDRYVLQEMMRCGSNLGGEPSGHVILSDRHTTGDGILTAVMLSEVLGCTRTSLDDWASQLVLCPQVLDSLRVREKTPLDRSAPAQESIAMAEKRLEGQGRVVVRYSGTEPLLRIMAEGADADLVRSVVLTLKQSLATILAS
ncbi:MAG: phosphoglucosamine mutase [Acidobacteriota bacterium]